MADVAFTDEGFRWRHLLKTCRVLCRPLIFEINGVSTPAFYNDFPFFGRADRNLWFEYFDLDGSNISF